MKKILLQAGHENAKNNCDANLARGTGAPGEAEFTVRIRNRLAQILLSKKNADGSNAFQVFLEDSTTNCKPDVYSKDYDLFLALHYDADIYGKGGGFTDFPDPSVDLATKDSQRIAGVIKDEYFKHSGIEYVNRSNANTKYYYMWQFLSAKTPCVIIECGVGQNAHDKVILADTDRVANAIARGICSAFGVSFDQNNAPTTDYKALYTAEKAKNDVLTVQNKKLSEINAQSLAKIENAKQALA